jgi:hypothetical protein
MRLPFGSRAAIALVWVSSFAACVGGCNGAPRSRLGALPYPGPTTLYATADPQNLGRHRYGGMPRLFRADEASRGIVYTARAGFLDIAHLRITIDQVRYCTREFRRAIAKRQQALELAGPNRSTFHVSMHYPDDWADLPPAERQAVAAEWSLRAGQRVGYLMVTWHELITWFGYRNVFLVDERRSAFLHDDVMSHVIGLRVAGRAIRAAGPASDGFADDDAVTAALSAELAELGAAPRACTDEAARRVEDVWWADGQPLKRQPDVGLESGVVRPWLVPGLACAPSPAEPQAFRLPRLDHIRGRDLSASYSVKISPNIFEAGRMRRLLPGQPGRFDADEHVPILLRHARTEMRQTIDERFDNPHPVAKQPGPTTSPTS